VQGFGPSFYGGGGSPPQYNIQVLGYNYERVRDIAEDLGRRLTRMSRIRDVDTNASGAWYDRDKATEFVVEIDRDALARYDMSVQEFVGRMSAVIQGQTRQDILKIGGEELRLDVKVEGFREVDLRELQETMITATNGTAIRIGDVVAVYPKEILARIRRENQQYERTVSYEFRGPTKLGDLVRDAVLEATVLPPGYSIKERERWRWSDEEREQIYMVLAISILLIYMVTAALFESMKQPLCVLLTVPMALIGVFLMFFYANATFTREAYIGVIMMGGIVVNNAILLVDHINQIRREGRVALQEAILQGTLERVRPILMTTTTTVLGLLPLVLFSQGADANIWNALAYALIGGLLSSTFFVLTTTPALYFLFERKAAASAA
jgi:HAE1 family hydrophobic/amphiphilic exporter-1